MKLKSAIKRIVRSCIFKENATSESLIKYLRARGAKIGTNVIIYAPNKTVIDKTAPWLIEIGDQVRITEGVKILTHDYSWSVLKCCDNEIISPGQILGAQSAVVIGNNVFVGVNSIITRGVKIGDNVIIGAGSVVTKDCEPNGVYAGNPATRIMSIEDFFQKRKDRQYEEAKDIAVRYRDRFGKKPPMEVFREYFMLFASGEDAAGILEFKGQMSTSDNYEACLRYMNEQVPLYSSYEMFLRSCYQELEEES